jgi:hypothetical protein
MKVHSSKRSRTHSHHPLPQSKPAVSRLADTIVHKSDNKARDNNSNSRPSEKRFVRALHNVYPPSKSVLGIPSPEHADPQFLGQPSVVKEVVVQRVGAGGMVPEEVVECPTIHRKRWIERTSVVVVFLSSDFGLERYAARAVVDADVTAADAEVEEHVVDVDWTVEKAVDALAAKFVVLQAYQFWDRS